MDTYECSCFADVDGGQLCGPAEGCRAKTLSAGPDARAIVPLQPGLRRLWQDPISRPHSQAAAYTGGMLQGCGRVRRSHGFDSGGRTSHASRDRQDCGRPGRAQEIYLSLQQCPSAEGKNSSVQAIEVSDL